MTSLPLPFMPCLAHRYGTENALMLAVLIELVGDYQGQVQVSEQRLYSRLSYIPKVRQIALLEGLVTQNLVAIHQHVAGNVNINLTIPQQTLTTNKHTEHYVSDYCPVNEHIVQPKVAMTSINRRERDDELTRIFAAKEYAIAKQSAMTLDWQPSASLLEMLQKNMQITDTFAKGLIDEFIVYSMPQGRTELPNVWDQKFLKYVKKEHAQKYVGKTPSNQIKESYSQNEENKFVNREKRRQLTAKVLDIHNTDW